jgi:serine/threonine protein kinase/formylglycine-generating enzyme required for sulfatase activity
MLSESLQQLIEQWERSGGRDTAEELCQQRPELLKPLREALEMLRRANQALDAVQSGTDTTRPHGIEQRPYIVKIAGYFVQSEIRRGGQAIVLKAIQESTGRTVAIKLLRDGALADDHARQRLQREISVLATLDHPNIVGVIDRGHTPDGHDYLVMDYIIGETLDDFLLHQPTDKRNGDPSALLRLFLKICDAVNVAHLRGITHRDLSPSNIMIDVHGEPKILDFGLARTAFDRFINQQKKDISVTGQFLGKLAYASPEQARGESSRIDIRTDVYALGVILYQMLTGGRFPYEVVGNIADVLNNIINAKPTPPSKVMTAIAPAEMQPRRMRKRHPPVVNDTIEAIVLKALEKNPEDRFQSAGEFAREIGNYLSGLPTIAGRRATSRSSFRRTAAKRIAVMIVFAGLLTVGVCEFLYWQWIHAPTREAAMHGEFRPRHSQLSHDSSPISSPAKVEAATEPAPVEPTTAPVAKPATVAKIDFAIPTPSSPSNDSAPPPRGPTKPIVISTALPTTNNAVHAQPEPSAIAPTAPATTHLAPNPLHPATTPVVVISAAPPATQNFAAPHATTEPLFGAQARLTTQIAVSPQPQLTKPVSVAVIQRPSPPTQPVAHAPQTPLPAAPRTAAPTAVSVMAPRKGDKIWTKNETLRMQFLYLPPGEFDIGSPADEKGRGDDEHQRRLKIAKGFYLQVGEVTQAQWRRLMFEGENETKFPIESVSYERAMDFCEKLSRLEDRHYRLPNEVEWEYACRAGTTGPWAVKEFASSDQAGPLQQTRSFDPNAFGLFDMHGNVSEWCEGAVLRGGSYYDDRFHCRSASRHAGEDRGAPIYGAGVRVLLEPP